MSLEVNEENIILFGPLEHACSTHPVTPTNAASLTILDVRRIVETFLWFWGPGEQLFLKLTFKQIFFCPCVTLYFWIYYDTTHDPYCKAIMLVLLFISMKIRSFLPMFHSIYVDPNCYHETTCSRNSWSHTNILAHATLELFETLRLYHLVSSRLSPPFCICALLHPRVYGNKAYAIRHSP